MQILHLRELLQAEDRDRASLEQQIYTLEGQVRSLRADLNNLQQQHAQLASDTSCLATEVSKLRRQLDQSQAAVEDGLASISDLIQQVDYLALLECQLTHSQVESVNLRRQLSEHTAVYDMLAEQDRDWSIAEHRTLLDTLNSAILGSRSSALTAQSKPRSATPAGSPLASTTQGSRSLVRRSRSRSFAPPAKRRRVQSSSRSRRYFCHPFRPRLLSLNPPKPSTKPQISTPSAPSSNSSPLFPSTTFGTELGSGESVESGSRLDDLTRFALSQSRLAARRQSRSDVRCATPDPSAAAPLLPLRP